MRLPCGVRDRTVRLDGLKGTPSYIFSKSAVWPCITCCWPRQCIPTGVMKLTSFSGVGGNFLEAVIVQIGIPMSNYCPNSLVVGRRELRRSQMTTYQTNDAEEECFHDR